MHESLFHQHSISRIYGLKLSQSVLVTDHDGSTHTSINIISE